MFIFMQVKLIQHMKDFVPDLNWGRSLKHLVNGSQIACFHILVWKKLTFFLLSLYLRRQFSKLVNDFYAFLWEKENLQW